MKDRGSRLYTFIDAPRELALYFFEGQDLIEELALRHAFGERGFGPDGFRWFRDVVLSVQPMIGLINGDEQLGLYIDSEDPFFRLKIETNHRGDMRSALFPEDFSPKSAGVERSNGQGVRLTGTVRVQRISTRGRPPYTSVMRIDSEPLGEVVNRVLEHSWQAPSAVVLSKRSDQSVMFHQLPPIAGRESYSYSPATARERGVAMAEPMEAIFSQALREPSEIESAFAAIGFRLLAGRAIQFRCNCSRERMIQTLRNLANVDMSSGPNDLFDPGEDSLEARCEYCKACHRISRSDLGQGDRGGGDAGDAGDECESGSSGDWPPDEPMH